MRIGQIILLKLLSLYGSLAFHFLHHGLWDNRRVNATMWLNFCVRFSTTETSFFLAFFTCHSYKTSSIPQEDSGINLSVSCFFTIRFCHFDTQKMGICQWILCYMYIVNKRLHNHATQSTAFIYVLQFRTHRNYGWKMLYRVLCFSMCDIR